MQIRADEAARLERGNGPTMDDKYYLRRYVTDKQNYSAAWMPVGAKLGNYSVAPMFTQGSTTG